MAGRRGGIPEGVTATVRPPSPASVVKRLLVGRPLSSAEQEHQRLPNSIALSTFSSDPISSTAYATEEILFVIATAAAV